MNITRLIDYLRVEGDALLNELRTISNPSINTIQKLIKNNPNAPVQDFLSQIKIQQKITAKIDKPDKYIFTRKGAEQCSSSLIAEYHARKLEGFNSFADLCCGIGIDLIAISSGKQEVYAVDLDSETLAAARYNCEASCHKMVKFLNDKAEGFAQPVDVVFADPDRRVSGSRVIKAEEMSPPLSSILALKNSKGNFVIKLAPALDYKSLKIDLPHTWEFVSENGTLKEILLCTGQLATPGIAHKAVLLPAEKVLTSTNADLEVTKLNSYILEPDPAIIRAALVVELGNKISYNLLDKHIALLTGSKIINTEFGKLYRVDFEMNYNLKKLKKYLKEESVGELIVKTRGFPETVEQFRKKFKLKGKVKKLMFIVRVGAGHKVIFATPIINYEKA